MKYIPDRYTVENFKRSLRQPQLFVEELRRLPFTFHSTVQGIWASRNGYGESDAVRLVEEDWDNLIIIDACRADLFEEVVDTDRFDQYRREVSIDSNTTPWSVKNFKTEWMGDTVYVTGNAAVSRTIPDRFHKFVEAWPDHWREWVYGDMEPEPVFEEAVKLSEEYQNKKMIVHFVQPHIPFIEHPELMDQDSKSTVWERIGTGEVDKDDVWEAYKTNLEHVMPFVFDLIEELPGRTILTSDHGNMLGETMVTGKPVYGHPGGVRCPELLEVPFCIIESDNRKKIVDEGIESGGSMDEEIIKKRLNALGYHE
jgi:hypothetical protein